jgi:hypothetical protein
MLGMMELIGKDPEETSRHPDVSQKTSAHGLVGSQEPLEIENTKKRKAQHDEEVLLPSAGRGRSVSDENLISEYYSEPASKKQKPQQNQLEESAIQLSPGICEAEDAESSVASPELLIENCKSCDHYCETDGTMNPSIISFGSGHSDGEADRWCVSSPEVMDDDELWDACFEDFMGI